MKKFSLILASDKRGGIGNKKILPWNFAKDTEYFIRKITTNSSFPTVTKNILIMGYKSFLDFLQRNIYSELIYVVARDSDALNIENGMVNVFYFDTFEQAIRGCEKELHSDVWVLGGKKIYEEALAHKGCEKIFATIVDAEFECDTVVDLSLYHINWNKEVSVNDINMRDNNEYTLIFKEGSLEYTEEHISLVWIFTRIINNFFKSESSRVHIGLQVVLVGRHDGPQ